MRKCNMAYTLVWDNLMEYPENFKIKEEREQYFFYRKEISWKEYLHLVVARFIDTNAKCNRMDEEELSKKQGICSTIFSEKPLPDFSLIVTDGYRFPVVHAFHGKTYLSVNDGGHRTRTGLEFEKGEFKTESGTYYLNPDNGVKVDIGDMTYDQIANEHPEAIKIWNNYPASICISRNASADDTVEDIRSRNKNTKMNHAQERNCFDNNIIADFIRFSVRTWIDINGEIHPDSEGIPHHPLFNADILGFNNKSHLYDEILTRIFLYSAASNSMVDAGHEELENLYIKGSKVIIQPGEYYIKKKLFEGVKSNTLLVCDFLYGVLSNWPKKHSYNKTQSLVNALVRWYFEYNKELKSHFCTMSWNGELKIDYEKFAKNFSRLMQDLTDSEETGIWTVGEKKTRLLSEALIGYLTQYNSRDKDKMAWMWIKDEFDSICKNGEFGDEREFGITLYDSRPSFNIKDIRERWKKVGECEELNGTSCDINDVHGDHIIPRSAGVRAGAITEPSNLQVLLEKDNLSKGAKSNEEFKRENVAA